MGREYSRIGAREAAKARELLLALIESEPNAAGAHARI
jgi:hypothetical protein